MQKKEQAQAKRKQQSEEREERKQRPQTTGGGGRRPKRLKPHTLNNDEIHHLYRLSVSPLIMPPLRPVEQ